MFKSVAKNNNSRGESLSSVTLVKQDRVGRGRLVHLDGEVQKAETAVAELEQRIQRLDAILVESEAAQRALQSAISADDGLSLASYSAGNAPADSEIAKLDGLGKLWACGNSSASCTADRTGRARQCERAGNWPDS